MTNKKKWKYQTPLLTLLGIREFLDGSVVAYDTAGFVLLVDLVVRGVSFCCASSGSESHNSQWCSIDFGFRS
jgi:hypothetical protein